MERGDRNRGAGRLGNEGDKILPCARLHRPSSNVKTKYKGVRDLNWAKPARSPSSGTSRNRDFTTPKRSALRCDSHLGDSPDAVQDIIWDPASPPPIVVNVSGKRRGKTAGERISDIVNKIAPTEGSHGSSDPSLLQWMGEGSIQCTPELPIQRTRRISSCQSNVEDLKKLAREFDLKISKEQQESSSHTEAPSSPARAQVADLDRELNALFDGPTQYNPRGLSQTSSTGSQEARDGQPPAAREGHSLPGQEGSRETSSVPAESVAANSAVDDDWENDDLLNDSFVIEMTQNPAGIHTDPSVICANTVATDTGRQTSSTAAAVRTTATTDRNTAPAINSRTTSALCPATSSVPATNSSSNVHSRPMSSKYGTRTLQVKEPAQSHAAAHGQVESSHSIDIQYCGVGGSKDTKLKQSTFMPGQSSHWQGKTLTSKHPGNNCPGPGQRGVCTNTHALPSVTHQGPKTTVAAGNVKQPAPGSKPLDKVGQNPKEAAVKDLKDQNVLKDGWGDEDEVDDSLLYQVCDVVERLSASQEERKAATNESAESKTTYTRQLSLSPSDLAGVLSQPMDTVTGSWPPRQPSTTNHRPASHSFSRSYSAPDNRVSISTSSAFAGKVQPSASSTFRNYQNKTGTSSSSSTTNKSSYTQLRDPPWRSSSTPSSTSSSCLQGPRGATPTVPGPHQSTTKRHLHEPRPLANKVFVPNRQVICSAAEIEKKKQEAIARRKVRLEALQKTTQGC